MGMCCLTLRSRMVVFARVRSLSLFLSDLGFHYVFGNARSLDRQVLLTSRSRDCKSESSQIVRLVNELLAYFSHYMRMVPGDILATGTRPGMRTGKNRYMAVGNILECGITNLGAQRQEIICERVSERLA